MDPMLHGTETKAG
jgi:glutaminase